MTSGSSVRLGLIGRGIDQSLAPAFHTIAGQMIGLDVTYELLPREAAFSTQLDEFLVELGQAGYHGVNVTVPFKASGWQAASDPSDDVVSTGVANTVLLGPTGPTRAFNTDFTGFKWAYRRRFADASPDTVALLGAEESGRRPPRPSSISGRRASGCSTSRRPIETPCRHAA